MNKYANSIILSVLAFALFGCAPELPEHYGVFAVDGNRITELSNAESANVQRDFSPDVKILVFDPVLGAGNLSLERFFSLHDTAYVRKVVTQSNKKAAEIISVENVTEDQFVTLKSTVDVKFQPVKDEAVMLYIKPSHPLQQGLYTLDLRDRKNFTFGVDLGGKELVETTSVKCVDRYVTVKTKSGEISLSDAMSALMTSRSGKKHNFCDVLDNNLAEWKTEAKRLIQNKEYEKASILVRNINEIDNVSGEKFLGDFLSSLQPEAQKAFDQEQWASVITLCSLAIDMGVSDADIQELLNSATENRDRERADRERKEREAREAAERKKAEEHAALLQKAKTPSKTLHTVTTSACSTPSQVSTKVTITDVNISFAEWCDLRNLTIWFGDIQRIKSGTISLIIYGKKKLHSSEEKKRKSTVAVFYRSKDDGKEMTQIITEAFNEWKNKYPSLAKSKS